MADADASRATLFERRYDLIRQLLPDMAASWNWPIRLDYCFTRACLDISFGLR